MPRRYRFDRWRLDPASGEIDDGDHRLRLQEQPLRLLLALLERPGEVVGRDELTARLWPDGTHVDHEHGIGNAVHKLREALGDAAAEPRFVETVPRRGYRWLATVEAVEIEGEPQNGLGSSGRARRLRRAAAVVAASTASWGLWAALEAAVERRAGDPAAPALSTPDAAARESYLRGEHLLARKAGDDVERSADYFRSAIERDPGFAEAWASLAYAYHFMGALGALEPEEAYRRASEAAHAALGIDPASARANAVLGETTFRFGPESAEAEPWFLRALHLDPHSAEIRHWYGNYLAAKGEPARALAELERAHELDPLDLHLNVDLAALLYESGRVEDARTRLAQTLELDPGYPKTHYLAGWMALREDRPEEAVAAFRRTVELAPGVPKFVHALASAAVRAGRREEAGRLLVQLASTRDRHVPVELIRDLESKLGASPVSR